jgi:PIN domain nuclease of toxin-antitoxin system
LQIKGFSPEDLPGACQLMGFEIENLSAEDSSTYHQLKATWHRDPFDRMLIWQAIRNGYTLISNDDNVKKYVSEGLKMVK